VFKSWLSQFIVKLLLPLGVLVYMITYDIGPCTRPLVPTSESLHVMTCPSHVSGGVEVYMWIVPSPFHQFGLLVALDSA
jgi:hypothetical protein